MIFLCSFCLLSLQEKLQRAEREHTISPCSALQRAVCAVGRSPMEQSMTESCGAAHWPPPAAVCLYILLVSSGLALGRGRGRLLMVQLTLLSDC